ncbi:DUF3658 domain-containing protein [Pseudaquabacterium pictum]|uniref:DUF3658 domain-containing protein n=1 Tax=Pseudaquabacterium pictum TaxID=2315236 RepID=A0A480ARB7_9BURK|nr:hypothetical protein AQPW35_16530 [Rubrivivax pictus]
MPQEKSIDLQAALEHAKAALTASVADVMAATDPAERSGHLRALATMLVGSHEVLRSHAIALCPELEEVEPTSDHCLHESEQKAVAQLKNADIDTIDHELLTNTTCTWTKAIRVIGETLVSLDNRFSAVPLGFYAQRVAALISSGTLEARGNTEFMRLCEIRLSTVIESAA